MLRLLRQHSVFVFHYSTNLHVEYAAGVLCFPGAGISVGTDFGWIPRGSHCSASGIHVHFTCEQCVPRISSWRHLGYRCGGQCCHESGLSRIWCTFSATQAESQLVPASSGFRVDLSAQLSWSCTPSTGSYGFYGWDVGWTLGALVLTSTVAGFANSFHFAYAEEQFIQGLRLPVDFVPITP